MRNCIVCYFVAIGTRVHEEVLYRWVGRKVSYTLKLKVPRGFFIEKAYIFIISIALQLLTCINRINRLGNTVHTI